MSLWALRPPPLSNSVELNEHIPLPNCVVLSVPVYCSKHFLNGPTPSFPPAVSMHELCNSIMSVVITSDAPILAAILILLLDIGLPGLTATWSSLIKPKMHAVCTGCICIYATILVNLHLYTAEICDNDLCFRNVVPRAEHFITVV